MTNSANTKKPRKNLKPIMAVVFAGLFAVSCGEEVNEGDLSACEGITSAGVEFADALSASFGYSSDKSDAHQSLLVALDTALRRAEDFDLLDHLEAADRTAVSFTQHAMGRADLGPHLDHIHSAIEYCEENILDT